MRRIPRALAALVALTMLAVAGPTGCASLPAVTDNSGVYSRTIFLAVDNRSQWQLEIFILVGGQRVRIGDVGPTSRKQLQFSTDQLLDPRRVQVYVAALSGEESWRSEIINLAVINEIILNVTPSLRQSNYIVR